MTAPYHRPKELAEALDLLASEALCIVAGCTDLFPATEYKSLQGSILDITGIPTLRGIKTGKDGNIHIGATTTWADMIRAPLPPAFEGLKRAASEVGARQIQNQATIVGNLCNASPAADGVPPLLTLDARVELQSAAGSREIALADFIRGPRNTDLRSGEMVTALVIPSTALTGKGHFKKLGARDYLVISIAMTAARIVVQDDIVVGAALAVGSCGPVAVRLTEIEMLMVGRPFDVSLISESRIAAAIAPIDDMRADAGYRRICAAELMRRTVSEIICRQEASA